MSESYTFGQIAEQRAVTYLKKTDYDILEQNYRYRKAEIDIIARKDNFIIVVEVKARSSSYFGAPESFVNRKKIQLLVMAIDAYIQKNDLDVEVRFDIISYLVENGNGPENTLKMLFTHFKNNVIYKTTCFYFCIFELNLTKLKDENHSICSGKLH